ncbi:MAG: beta family protein [Coriobacteriia bacterium]
MSEQTTRYVPILKCKRGELTALASVPPEVAPQMTPLLVIPSTDGALGAYVEGRLREALRAWPRDAYVDASSLEPEEGEPHPAMILLAAAGAAEWDILPVDRLAYPAEVQAALGAYATERNGAVLLRLSRREFGRAPEAVEASIQEAIERLGIGVDSLDVMLDFGSLEEEDIELASVVVAGLLRQSALLQACRSLVVAGSGFPEGSPRDAFTWVEALRTEWLMWQQLRADAALPRLPLFSDYGAGAVEQPEFSGFVSLSAKIKYTLEDRWLLIRSRKTNGGEEGNEQFNELCRLLVQRGVFAGEDFSAGDRRIGACAADPTYGPGNTTTWVTVAMSHHVMFVLSQLAIQA